MALACLAATTGIAEEKKYDGDYSNHQTHIMFRDAPCKEVIATIDYPFDLDGTVRQTTRHITRLGMAFGFLVGVDAMFPGIAGSDDTLLIRLRKSCAETPDRPALDILREYVTELQ